MIWIFISLAAIANSITCTQYSCAQLDAGVCALMEANGAITLNDEVCEGDMTCRLPAMYLWKYIALYGETLSCEPAITRETGLHTFRITCGERQSDKEPAEGSNPKQCKTDDDCFLQDGTQAECKCGLGGKAYCRPDANSSTFDAYWKACEEGWGELSNYDTFTYAAMLSSFYSEQVDPVSCSKALFLETVLLDDLKDGKRDTFINSQSTNEEDSGAEVLAWSAIGALLLA